MELEHQEKLAGAGIVTLRSGDSWDSLGSAEPGSSRHSQPQKSKERELGRH